MGGNALEMFVKISLGRFDVMVLDGIFRQNVAHLVELGGGVAAFVKHEVVDPLRFIQKEGIVPGIKIVQHMRKPDNTVHFPEGKELYDIGGGL